MNFKNLAMWGIIVLLTIGLYNMFKNPKGAMAQKNNIAFLAHCALWVFEHIIETNSQENYYSPHCEIFEIHIYKVRIIGK